MSVSFFHLLNKFYVRPIFAAEKNKRAMQQICATRFQIMGAITPKCDRVKIKKNLILDFDALLFLINHCHRHQNVQNQFFQSWQIFGYRKRRREIWFLQKSLLEQEMQRLLTFCSTEFYLTNDNSICIGFTLIQSLHLTSLSFLSLSSVPCNLRQRYFSFKLLFE